MQNIFPLTHLCAMHRHNPAQPQPVLQQEKCCSLQTCRRRGQRLASKPFPATFKGLQSRARKCCTKKGRQGTGYGSSEQNFTPRLLSPLWINEPSNTRHKKSPPECTSFWYISSSFSLQSRNPSITPLFQGFLEWREKEELMFQNICR